MHSTESEQSESKRFMLPNWITTTSTGQEGILNMNNVETKRSQFWKIITSLFRVKHAITTTITMPIDERDQLRITSIRKRTFNKHEVQQSQVLEFLVTPESHLYRHPSWFHASVVFVYQCNAVIDIFSSLLDFSLNWTLSLARWIKLSSGLIIYVSMILFVGLD